MRVSVIDAALKKRNLILSRMSRLSDLPPPPLEWRSLPPKEGVSRFVGVDGGMNYLMFKSCVVYAISSCSVAASYDGVKVLEEAADVDVLLPYWLPEERIRLYMSILELRACLRALNRIKDAVAVLDGSLLSMMVRPWRYGGFHFLKEVEAVTLEGVEDEASATELRIASKDLVEELRGDEIAGEKVLAIEYSEYLALLRKLLLEYGDRVVAIAKRTQAEAFRRGYPTLVLIERGGGDPGYAVNDTIRLDELRRAQLYRRFFEGVALKVVYVRFERNGPVLKIEVPERACLEEILVGLSKYCVKGYPYFLIKAHENAVVSERDMRMVARILGLYGMETGREVLAL